MRCLAVGTHSTGITFLEAKINCLIPHLGFFRIGTIVKGVVFDQMELRGRVGDLHTKKAVDQTQIACIRFAFSTGSGPGALRIGRHFKSLSNVGRTAAADRNIRRAAVLALIRTCVAELPIGAIIRVSTTAGRITTGIRCTADPIVAAARATIADTVAASVIHRTVMAIIASRGIVGMRTNT